MVKLYPVQGVLNSWILLHKDTGGKKTPFSSKESTKEEFRESSTTQKKKMTKKKKENWNSVEAGEEKASNANSLGCSFT